MADFFHNRSQPGPVGRQAAVILNNDVDLVFGPEFGQPAQPVGGTFELVFIGLILTKYLSLIDRQDNR